MFGSFPKLSDIRLTSLIRKIKKSCLPTDKINVLLKQIEGLMFQIKPNKIQEMSLNEGLKKKIIFRTLTREIVADRMKLVKCTDNKTLF